MTVKIILLVVFFASMIAVGIYSRKHATNVNDFVLFRNTSETFSTTERLIKFEMTGKIAAAGNIQSLLNFSENVPIYSFYKLFDNCKSLLTAPQ